MCTSVLAELLQMMEAPPRPGHKKPGHVDQKQMDALIADLLMVRNDANVLVFDLNVDAQVEGKAVESKAIEGNENEGNANEVNAVVTRRPRPKYRGAFVVDPPVGGWNLVHLYPSLMVAERIRQEVDR